MTEETFEYSLAALPVYLNIFTYFKMVSKISRVPTVVLLR